jgi:hypothetical protein
LAAFGFPSQTTLAAVAGSSLMMGSNLLALEKLVNASSVEGLIALYAASVSEADLTIFLAVRHSLYLSCGRPPIHCPQRCVGDMLEADLVSSRAPEEGSDQGDWCCRERPENRKNEAQDFAGRYFGLGGTGSHVWRCFSTTKVKQVRCGLKLGKIG